MARQLTNAIRSLLFYIAITVWILTFPTLLTPLRWARPAFGVRIAHGWLAGVVWLARVICGIRYELHGKLPVQTGPVILACQHQSAWETFFLPVHFGMPMMVVKKELLSIPIFGAYLRYCGMAAIDRKAGVSAIKQVVDKAQAALGQGRNVLVFPEGTRVAYGAEGKIQAGIAALYEQCEAPVVPISHDAGKLWPRSSLIKSPGVVSVVVHPPLPKGLSKQQLSNALKQIYYKTNAASSS